MCTGTTCLTLGNELEGRRDASPGTERILLRNQNPRTQREAVVVWTAGLNVGSQRDNPGQGGSI